LSARGSRQLGDSVEKIEDPAELAQVRKQARLVNIKSIITGIALTLISLLIP
jgi:hypothetical protein